MTVSLAFFDLPTNSKIDDFVANLHSHFTVEENATQHVKRVYLDTFDWRLFTAGLQLECGIVDRSRVFILQQAEAHKTVATLRTKKPIHFAWDLPESTLKKQLAPLIEMRALLPVVSLRSTLLELNILNKDEKTVLRIRIEENKLQKTPASPGTLLNRAVVLQSVRGYNRPYESALSLLKDTLKLKPSSQDVYSQALVKSKILPGHYSSKLNIRLDPQMRADAASKIILLDLLETLRVNEPGTIDDIDSEFLHDFRVACRRTRSALSQIKDVFPPKTTERYKREFAWLGSVTGPTRDLDVYLLTFDDYKKQVPEHLQTALEPLHDFLRQQQTLEQTALAKALHSARYQRLTGSWRQFLENPVPARPTVANAPKPIIAVANERTWKMYQRVIDEGEAIKDDSPPEELHELRKSCKKLRYLMEFFNSLYPEHDISKLIKALKQLQSNLGDYNDLHVQIESLERFGKLMMEHEPPPAETFLAMGSIIESLDQKQLAVRHEFKSRFSQFNSPEYHALFTVLFAGYDAAEPTVATDITDTTMS
jgi:CHAD domain-containing protein